MPGGQSSMRETAQGAEACGRADWSDGVTRRRVDPLREVTEDERTVLTEVSRARQEPASHVVRAQALLAVAAGQSYVAAAHAVGRQNGDWVAGVVARFNKAGLAALQPGHGGGQPVRYGATEQARIVTEARRTPERDADGTAVWSLTTLQRALRRAPDGLPTVSTYTIWWVLRDAGWSWQRSRTWCDTGTVQRQRKSGTVTVIDPDTAAKKN